MDLFLLYIPFKGEERPAKTKFVPAKLCAVLTSAKSTPSCVNRRGVSYSRKRIFQQNHFCLFIRGPGGLDSRGKNANKSRDTATSRVTEGNSADGNSLAFNFSVADPDPHGSVPVTFSWIRIRNYSSGSSKK